MKPIKRALCAALCAALLLGLFTPASAADFTDVSSAHWAYSDVMWAKSSGIVEGVGDNKFAPGKNVSTAEMVKMLCGAFFSGEYQAYAAAHPGQGSYWYSPMAEFFEAEGLLKGIIITISSNESMTAPMSRYNMAEIITNVLAKKGVAATDAQKEAAKSQLGSPASFEDYHVQSAHEDAILNTYALGIINGIDGRFEGSQSMTRAQACAVLHRMSNLLGGTAPTVPVEPGPVTSPTPDTVKKIEVTSQTNPAKNLTGCNVPDNGFPTGYLNNGKPITEENVLELLHEAQDIWPSGLKWDEHTTNNNMYQNPSRIATEMMSAAATGTKRGSSSSYACGGFAAMLSDYIFGHNSNPYHLVTDLSKIRPGDMIIMITIDDQEIDHVSTAVSAAATEYAPDGKAYPNRIYTADGNGRDGKGNGFVGWDWPDNPELGIYATRYTEDPTWERWLVFSRYPE